MFKITNSEDKINYNLNYNWLLAILAEVSICFPGWLSMWKSGDWLAGDIQSMSDIQSEWLVPFLAVLAVSEAEVLTTNTSSSNIYQ